MTDETQGLQGILPSKKEEPKMSEDSQSLKAYLASHLREYGLLFALIAIMAFFQVVTDGTLMRPVNISAQRPLCIMLGDHAGGF